MSSEPKTMNTKVHYIFCLQNTKAKIKTQNVIKNCIKRSEMLALTPI